MKLADIIPIVPFYYGRSLTAFDTPAKVYYSDTHLFQSDDNLNKVSPYSSSSSFVLNYINKRFGVHKFINFSNMPATLRDFQTSFRSFIKPYKHFLIPIFLPPPSKISSIALFYMPDRRITVYGHFPFFNLSFYFFFNFRAFFIYRFYSFTSIYKSLPK